MKTIKRLALFTGLIAAAPLAFAGNSLDGRWDAQLLDKGYAVPFRLDLAGDGKTLQGTLYDGFRPSEHTTGASYKDGQLALDIAHYQTTIRAELKDGKLVGKVRSNNRIASEYDFVATRHDDKADVAAANAKAPDISGDWVVPLDAPSSKGEKAYNLVIEQHGPEAAASFYRVDGDTGALNGTYKDGKWLLSHYDGSRESVVAITPQADGTLKIERVFDVFLALQKAENGSAGAYAYKNDDDKKDRNSNEVVAYRPEVAKTKGLPQPDDHFAHTTARDPHEKFVFNFKDLQGRTYTQDDPYFKGKPILAIVTGTWCPNCHDEAKYLVQLDKKYHDQGLRIVALDFEEQEQLASQSRAKAFVAQYEVKYPYLIAGAPEEMWEKVPQLNNLNTWPATVFIGRDGTIRAVHAGFGSPSTGDLYAAQDKEFTDLVHKLLAEPTPIAEVPAVAQSVAAR